MLQLYVEQRKNEKTEKLNYVRWSDFFVIKLI